MNPRLLLCLAINISVISACLSQAVVSTIRHETLDQKTIAVTFNQPLTGTTTTGQWTVFINGVSTNITVTGVSNFQSSGFAASKTFTGTSTVYLQFDASLVSGRTATASYLLPGETLSVSYSGNTLNGGGTVATFGPTLSQNNTAWSCSEIKFYQQGTFLGATPDQCVPVTMNFTQYQFYLTLRFRNSSVYNASNLNYNLDWGDGTTQLVAPGQTNPAGTVDNTYFESTSPFGSVPAIILTSRPSHTYPNSTTPTGATDQCSWEFKITPIYSGSSCPSLGQSTIFANYDTDNKNTGLLNLPPSVTNSNIVCLGTNVNMMFSDATSLNCRTAVEAGVPNQLGRYIRIVYGHRDWDEPTLAGTVNNIPDIRVGGIPVTMNDANGTRLFVSGYYPTGAGGIGTPDANGVIDLGATVTASTATAYMKQIITTLTTNHQAEQRFWVRLDYWDICNPYDPSAPDGNKESLENFVRIITTPVAPSWGPSGPFCESVASNSFNIAASGVGVSYSWYKDSGLATLLQSGADNTFNPVTEGASAHRINKTVSASTIFHRYVTVTGSNGCTSLPADVVIQIDDTNSPGSIRHPLDPSNSGSITVCSATDPVSFTNFQSASGGNGTFNYQWQASTTSVSTGFNDIGGATSATYDPGSITTTTWFRRRARSGACADVFSNVIQFVPFQPAAVLSGGGSICLSTPAPPVQFAFTGTGPWNLQYAIDGVTQPTVTGIATTPYTITTPGIGAYTLVSLTDLSLSCAAPAGNLTGGATVVNSAVAPPSVVSFAASSPVCDDAGTTVPPSATLILNPAANYDFTYTFNGNVHPQTNVATTGAGEIVISPPYTEWGSAAGSYKVIVTAIKNTATGCSGVVPINSASLVVNPRPATPTGPVNAAACNVPGAGAAIRVSDPDPTNTLSLDITWSTGGPARASFFAVAQPTDGIVSSTNQNIFTPASSATATFYAFNVNTSTGCLSNSGVAVTQTQETMPTANAGIDQDICVDSPTANLTATNGGGLGAWSSPGKIAYYQNFAGIADGTSTRASANGWSLDVSDPQSFNGGTGYFRVQSERFEGFDTNGNLTTGTGNIGEVIWMSPIIDISSLTAVQATVDLVNVSNNLDGGPDADYIKVYYKLNGGAETLFNSNGSFTGNGWTTPTATAFASSSTGSTIQIIVKVSTNENNEKIAFDNITVKVPSTTFTIANPNNGITAVSNLPVPVSPATVATTTLRWSVLSPLEACRADDDINIRVNVLPTTTVITPVLCDDVGGAPIQSSVDLSTYSSSVTNAPTVQWFSDALRTTPFLLSGNQTITNGKTFYWKGTSSVGCSNIGQVTFTVDALPTALDQVLEFCQDASTGINLTAFEPVITNNTSTQVEWFEDNGSGGLGSPIDNPATVGFNEETNYSITATKTVYAKVTNASSTATPKCFDIANIQLKYKPKPANNAVSGDQSLCSGSAIKVYQTNPTVNMFGSIHEYVWSVSGTAKFTVYNSNTVQNTNSYTATTSDFLLVLSFPNSGTFNITMTEKIDGCLGNSASYPITVAGIPPALAFLSPDKVVCKNESVGYSLTTTNGSLYTWTVVGGTITSGPSSGTGLTSVTILWGTQVNPQPELTVVETNGTGCSGSPASENITIQDIPVVAQTLDKTVCNNEACGIKLAVNGGGPPASLYNLSAIAVAPGLTTASNVTPRIVSDVNSIASDQFVNPTNKPLTVKYSVIPHSPAGCAGLKRDIILTVEPKVVANFTNSTPSLCSNTTTQITLQSPVVPSSGDISFNYTAAASNGLVTGFSPVVNNLGNGFIISDVLINNDNQPRNVTYQLTPVAKNAKNGIGCTGSSSPVQVAIEPKPKLSILPNTASVCEGTPLAFALSTNTTPSSGNIVFTMVGTPLATGGVTGFSFAGTTFNNGDLLKDVLNNPTLVSQTVTYILRPDALSVNCSGDAVPVVVEVNAKPSIAASVMSAQICSGTNTNVELTFDIPNSTGDWTTTPDINIIGSSSGSGTLIFQTLVNTSTSQGRVKYTVVPKSPSGCEGTPVSVLYAVDPIPDLTVTPDAQTICSGTTTGLSINSTLSTAAFTWTSVGSGPNITGFTNGDGNLILQTLKNTATIGGNVQYTITPKGPFPTLCVGASKTVIVNVGPPVSAEFTSTDKAICKGATEFVSAEIIGQAPFTFIYSDGVSSLTEKNVGNIFSKQVTPAKTTTYVLQSVRDSNGCSTFPANETVTISVGEASAAFTLLDPTPACSPRKVQFKYDQTAGLIYTWKFFDGSADSVYTANTTSAGKVIAHTFPNPSPSTVASYKVNLVAETPATMGGCSDTGRETVVVLPNVVANVFPDKTSICSGEKISFLNQTQGAQTNEWYYREKGTTQQLESKTTQNVAYTFNNTSAQNPITYEIVYKGSNGSCPADKIVPVTVYRAVSASFTEGTIPPFAGGQTIVNFQNTSTPLTSNGFAYNWDFGAKSSPGTSTSGGATVPVVYSTAGPRDVTLLVVNKTAQTAGLKCESSFKKTITILLPPLMADFTVSPYATCFPAKITVLTNTSTGDSFSWDVVDAQGRIAATAIAPKPVFTIATPGTYKVVLTTTNSLTGQSMIKERGGIQVFEIPFASFEVRPTTIFIPDTEMKTFNLSTKANQYDWDFGDGGTSTENSPSYLYKKEGTFKITLIAGNDYGLKDADGDGVADRNVICYDTATTEVTAREGGLVKIPNAFTPSKDGPSGGIAGGHTINDVFLPLTKGISEEEGSYVLQVFDRWGNLIFESRKKTIGWDGYDKNGNLLPGGVYVYKLDLRLVDGQRTQQIGDITLIR